MNPVAAAFLEKLLQKAERARIRGDDKAATLPITAVSWPEYFSQPRREHKDEINATVELAARSGGAAIEWDRRAGDRAHLSRVTVVDPCALAAFLRRPPYWEVAAAAAAKLEPYSEFPVAQKLAEAWQKKKTIRGFGPEDVGTLLRAMDVVVARKASRWEDVAVRRVSADLFGDSKVIEGITGALDLVTTDDVLSPPGEREDVLSGLGLVRFPQPILLSGSGTIRYTDGFRLDLHRPYLGVPPRAIAGAEIESAYLMTVENLTTFQEIAALPSNQANGLFIYAGGSPSPSMLDAYRAMLRGLSSNVRIYHWGDCDLGGFRIASRYSAVAKEFNREVTLWRMAPAELSGLKSYRAMTKQEANAIRRLAGRHGWKAIEASIADCSLCTEQEAQPLQLPLQLPP